MLEQDLLDDISRIRLRKPFHSLLEITLIAGHFFIFAYCFYQMFLLLFLSVDAVEEFIFMLMNVLAFVYVYSWHRFSVDYDNQKKRSIPVYLNTLKALSYFVSSFLVFMGIIFINFEAYKLEMTAAVAELMTLFFIFLGILQFIYTLLSPTKAPK